MELKKDKIVLHTCCAICSGYPVSFLQDTGYQVISYFYNPNIYPYSEYQKRLEAEKAEQERREEMSRKKAEDVINVLSSVF